MVYSRDLSSQEFSPYCSQKCNKQSVPSNKCFQLESVLQGKMLDAKVKFEADLISNF